MISVANDLLNNSPGLCWGTDGRPNTYTDMFTDGHTCASMHLFFICIYSNMLETFTHTHTLLACTHQGRLCLSPLLLTPRVLHVSTALVPWYHPPAHSLSEQEKVSRNFYLHPSWLSIVISPCLITSSVCMHHSELFQYIFVFNTLSKAVQPLASECSSIMPKPSIRQSKGWLWGFNIHSNFE